MRELPSIQARGGIPRAPWLAIMSSKLTMPDIYSVLTADDRPALLLKVGPGRWPVLIAREDFDHVTLHTGYRHWGIHGRNVVVGDAARLSGRPAVARLITEAHTGFAVAFRDGNPLNLLRGNLGLRGRASGKVWWLELLPGEVDPVHDTRGLPNRFPASIAARREIVSDPRPVAVPWPKRLNPTRKGRRSKPSWLNNEPRMRQSR